MNDFKILLVDDEPDIVDSISRYFQKDYNIDCFTSSLQALHTMKEHYYDIAIVDYKMPELNGLELFIEAKKINAYTYGILFTAYPDKNLLGDMLNKNLVFRYVEKPIDYDELESTFKNAIQYCSSKKEKEQELLTMQFKCEELQNTVDAAYDRIIGIERGLKAVYTQAMRVAQYPVNVLLTGETGTGKELFAHAIHKMSPRKDGSFIPINCGALPEELIESELFGHVKGAFTGALKDKPGKIELAHNGTLFLDEIAELKPDLQVKLLRVLQDKKIERLGSNRTQPVNFRLIAATNKDLQALMQKEQFRDDLYFRLNEVTIHIPPLRERKEDLEDLILYFAGKYCRELNLPLPHIPGDLINVLGEYPWKGNIRELSNAIKRMIIFCQDKKEITPGDFAFLWCPAAGRALSDKEIIAALSKKIMGKEIDFKDLKNLVLKEILNSCNGHIATAVEKTGIKRDQFYKAISNDMPNGEDACAD